MKTLNSQTEGFLTTSGGRCMPDLQHRVDEAPRWRNRMNHGTKVGSPLVEDQCDRLQRYDHWSKTSGRIVLGPRMTGRNDSRDYPTVRQTSRGGSGA